MTFKTSLARLAGRVSQSAAVLALASAAVAQTPIFQEVHGLVAIEVESVAPQGDWSQETLWSGFTGSSYFRWAGPNQYLTPGFGVLRYDFEVSQSGVYNIRLRNRHNLPDPTEENDCWVRLNGQGEWIKFYSNNGPGTVNVWNWVCTFEINHVHLNPEFTMQAGHNYIEFSGRSTNYMIDRFHLFQGNHPNGTNENVPQSPYDNSHNYCVGMTTSGGCTPTIGTDGSYPSDSGATPFFIRANRVPSGTLGVMFMSFSAGSMPYLGGTFCLAGGLLRSPVVAAAPVGGCDGTLEVNLTTMTSAYGSLMPGSVVHAQFLFRDVGAPSFVGLTNALRFTLQP
jgi:hypothetical protein